ncbi:hypothetical protein D3C78_922590 [compost metagenome]
MQHGSRRTFADQTVGTDDLGQLAQDLDHRFGAVDLGGRGQRHIHAPVLEVGGDAEVDQAHGFQARVALGQRAAHPGLVDGLAALLVGAARPQVDAAEQPGDLVRPGAEAEALVVELRGDQPPATVQLADQHVGRHLDVVVVGRRGGVAAGRNHRVREAGQRGVEDQDRHTLVARALRVGARGQPDVVGRLGAGGPQLVAVDHEVVAFRARGGLQHRQVGAGVRFGIADGEDDLAGGDAGQELLLLQRAAVLHQRRTDRADGDERQRRAGDVGFLEEDQLLGGGVALAAVRLRPAHCQPAIAAHLADGLAIQVAAFLAAQLAAQLRGHQVLEVVPHLQAQGVLLGGQIDEHVALLMLRRGSGRWWARRCRR